MNFKTRKIIKRHLNVEFNRATNIEKQFNWLRINKPDMVQKQTESLKILISLKNIKAKPYIKLLDKEKVNNLYDLEEHLEELSIKLAWQEKYQHLSINERIEELEKLIKTLPDEEATPYKNLLKTYNKWLIYGI